MVKYAAFVEGVWIGQAITRESRPNSS
ncbi:hypothetical protein [Arthrobacter gandavensis]